MEIINSHYPSPLSGLWKYLRIIYFDVLFLIRQGFIVAYGIVVLAYAAVLVALPPSEFKTGFIIFAVYSDTSIVGFYFTAAMMYLEKDQNLLVNWNIMPVTWRHYVVSKLITFSVLSVVISYCLYIPFLGLENLSGFTLGVILSVMLNIPLGLILAAKVKKLLNFLLLSVTILFPQILPLIDIFGLYESIISRVLPGYGILLLMGKGQEFFTGNASYWYLVSSVAVAMAVIWLCIRFLERTLGKKTGGTI